jgi:hypothetical protein
MTVRLNVATLRAVFPQAPDAIIAAFVTHHVVNNDGLFLHHCKR